MNRHCLFFIMAAMVCLFLASAVWAQPETSMQPDEAISQRIASLEAQVKESKTAGDNSWLLMSSAHAHVTGPGLALFMADWCERRMCFPP
jgi:hypothetical protein